ncbi:MAG: sigma-70 family RNA polymerase sigma factor [Acidobacteriota bacterium]
MSLDAATAVDLVERIAGGDADAEAELIQRIGRTLRFLTRRFTRHEADADDLYQETLVVALEKIRRGDVREPQHLAAYLRALAKNLCTQKYRRRSYQVEKTSGDVPDAADERHPGALSGLLHDEQVHLTRRLLGELRVPRDREVLFRYYIAEHDSAHICDELGIAGDHFYRVLHRARQRYRELWEQSASPPPRSATDHG